MNGIRCTRYLAICQDSREKGEAHPPLDEDRLKYFFSWYDKPDPAEVPSQSCRRGASSGQVGRCVCVDLPTPVAFGCAAQVLKMEEAPARLVEVATLREHDDIVSSVATARGHDGFVLSGSHDRRWEGLPRTVAVAPRARCSFAAFDFPSLPLYSTLVICFVQHQDLGHRRWYKRFAGYFHRYASFRTGSFTRSLWRSSPGGTVKNVWVPIWTVSSLDDVFFHLGRK